MTSRLADAVGGYEDAVEAGQEVPARLALAVDAVFWDPDKDAYVDSIHRDGARSAVTSQTTNAMTCRYGLAGSARCDLLHQRFDKRDSALLKYGSPAGLYYVLELLDFMGDSVTILRFVWKYWGDMMHAGDGTCGSPYPSLIEPCSRVGVIHSIRTSRAIWSDICLRYRIWRQVMRNFAFALMHRELTGAEALSVQSRDRFASTG